MRGYDQPGLSPGPRSLLIPHELEEWDGVGGGSLPGDEGLRKLAGQNHLALQVYCLLRFPWRMGPHHAMLFSLLPLCSKGDAPWPKFAGSFTGQRLIWLNRWEGYFYLWQSWVTLIVFIVNCYSFGFKFLLKIQVAEFCTQKYSESETIESHLQYSL